MALKKRTSKSSDGDKESASKIATSVSLSKVKHFRCLAVSWLVKMVMVQLMFVEFVSSFK